MPVKITWRDREFERQELDPRIVRWLNRIGARGEAITKKLIGGPGPLHAVDKGFLLNSISWVIDARKQIIRIGTYIPRPDGKSLLYAVFVFKGTPKMRARPALRTMLAMLLVEMKK